jgi:hypothetical protein
MNKETIEQVVKEVFEILSQRHVNQSSSSEANNNSRNIFPANIITEAVITEEVLRTELDGQDEIVFQSKAIITPSAQDYLRENQIRWIRQSVAQNNSGSSLSSNWKIWIASPTEQIETILKEINKNRDEVIPVKLSADLKESVSDAISGICRAEMSSGIILTELPEEAACQLNRNQKIKAASVSSTNQLQKIRNNWNPNLFCVTPSGHSYFELRNLIKAIINS